MVSERLRHRGANNGGWIGMKKKRGILFSIDFYAYTCGDYGALFVGTLDFIFIFSFFLMIFFFPVKLCVLGL
jgi:hypothetical protein